MIGSSEAGLVELIDYVLKLFSADEQQSLVNNIFLTGSSCKFPGLIERLNRELTEIRPFKSSFKVSVAKDPTLDGWFGAQKYAKDNNLKDISVSRANYQEFGGDFLRTHGASNAFFETPMPIQTELILWTVGYTL